ncbi:MAG: hypothetical protein AB1634_13340 [Thermodesulfobacteriota bacterium]
MDRMDSGLGRRSACGNALAALDALDRWSILALVVLVLAASWLVWQAWGQAGPEGSVLPPAAQTSIVGPDFEPRVDQARDMLAGDNPELAEELIRGLTADYPYQGWPHFLLGELAVRRQQPVAAMLAFRDALDRNPDFLDKKTPLFQGKKIRNAVAEAEVALTARPGDAEVQRLRKVLHYMKRRIAGSCG